MSFQKWFQKWWLSFALKLPFLNNHFLFANKHSSSRKFQRLRNLISNPYQGKITVKILLKKIISKNCQPRQFIKRQLFQILMLGQALQNTQYNSHINQQTFHWDQLIWSRQTSDSTEIRQSEAVLSEFIQSGAIHFKEPPRQGTSFPSQRNHQPSIAKYVQGVSWKKNWQGSHWWGGIKT